MCHWFCRRCHPALAATGKVAAFYQWCNFLRFLFNLLCAAFYRFHPFYVIKNPFAWRQSRIAILLLLIFSSIGYLLSPAYIVSFYLHFPFKFTHAVFAHLLFYLFYTSAPITFPHFSFSAFLHQFFGSSNGCEIDLHRNSLNVNAGKHERQQHRKCIQSSRQRCKLETSFRPPLLYLPLFVCR